MNKKNRINSENYISMTLKLKGKKELIGSIRTMEEQYDKHS
jgi:hypothetical protein